MAVKFQDYYQTLGVERGATQADIQRAYRKLARQYHPDVNKAKDAEAKFKQLNEAYEVLKDPEKRKKYDELGENWKAGQEFRPPPGWQTGRQQSGGAGQGDFAGNGFQFRSGDAGDFSDFFEAFFGRGEGTAFEEAFGHGGHSGGGGRGFGRGGRVGRRASGGGPQAGITVESHLTLPLEDLYHGATRTITLAPPDEDPHLSAAPGSSPTSSPGGRGVKTLEVKIPKGLTDGATMRLKGQGLSSDGHGEPGDLLLHVHAAPHPRFELDGRDLKTTLAISPWEAALGAKVPVTTLDGQVQLTIAPGTPSGRTLRLRGKGLPGRGGNDPGDLLVRIKIVVPTTLTDRERELLEQLQKESRFNPRAE
jgi:curved DNA-binding protein